MRWSLATAHLIALGIGLGAVWARSRALRGQLDIGAIRRILTADTWWGVAALLWLTTGLWRLFAATEKPSTYYMHSQWFIAKMGLFLLIVVLEIWPAFTFVRWRALLGRGGMPDARSAPALATISGIQAVLLTIIVGLAVAMARGY